jgi:hypothetical protein
MTAHLPLPPLTARAGTTTHLAIPGGFLHASYGEQGLITDLHVTRTADGEAVGLQLYFMDGGRSITCKTAVGLSGQSWSGGVARWGTVYDDDGAPDPGEAISQEEWLGDCLWKMVAGLAGKA